MNYLLVSPNFPISQEFFAKELKEKGINSPKDMANKKYSTWGLPVEQTIIENLIKKTGKITILGFMPLGNEIDLRPLFLKILYISIIFFELYNNKAPLRSFIFIF